MNRVVSLIYFLLMATAAMAQPISFESKMEEYNLIDIQSLDSTILVELKYSTTDNFVGEDMYGELEKAYFVKSFADRVVIAQRILKSRHPEYTLLIYDATRPISVQRHMRKIVEGTEFEGFVADGTRGGRHNYGVAVDLTIATCDGTPLDMGAGFDDFSDAASVKGTPDSSDPKTRTLDIYRRHAHQQVECSIITLEAAENRLLLIEVMLEAGLYPYRREWWHFEEIISITETRSKYKLVDF
jgi:D-alanyl-D-alanine dipeptidase